MSLLPAEKYLEYLRYTAETTYLEFKGDVSWSDLPKKHEIIRTIIAFANQKGGGTIIVGKKDKAGELVGLSQDHLKTFSHDGVNEFLRPKINQAIDCKVIIYHDIGLNKDFVFINVQEVSVYPVIYTGDISYNSSKGEDRAKNIGLRKHALYIRGGAPISSREIESIEEWKDIIERTYKRYEKEAIKMHSIVSSGKPNKEIDSYDSKLIP